VAARDLFAESLRRQYAAGNSAGVAEGLNALAALAVAQRQLERAARLFGAAETMRIGTLTAREREVAARIAQGATNRGIA
jgi:FixJ family two-component response regulator